MIRIKVQHKETKDIVWFACFDSNHPDLFIFQKYKLESQFEHGFIRDYEPVGLTWKEIRNAQEG